MVTRRLVDGLPDRRTCLAGRFGLGGLTLIASLFGLSLGRKEEITHEAIPAEGPKSTTA